ncbi:hypothetical protein CHUAL_010941 [Chamberlinius hualienensis]
MQMIKVSSEKPELRKSSPNDSYSSRLSPPNITYPTPTHLLSYSYNGCRSSNRYSVYLFFTAPADVGGSCCCCQAPFFYSFLKKYFLNFFFVWIYSTLCIEIKN